MQRRQWIAPIEIKRDVRAHDLAQPLRQRKFADRVQLAECEKVRNRIQHDEVQLIRARDFVMSSRQLAVAEEGEIDPAPRDQGVAAGEAGIDLDELPLAVAWIALELHIA